MRFISSSRLDIGHRFAPYNWAITKQRSCCTLWNQQQQQQNQQQQQQNQQQQQQQYQQEKIS